MKKLIALSLVSLLSGFLQAATDESSVPVRVRKVAESPFVGGRRVERLWSRADTLSGFIVPGRLDVAIDRTEAQLLYDESFLYVSLKGFFKKGCANRPSDTRLFRDSNFELFVSGSKTADGFRQFAVSQGGLVYHGAFSDGAKSELPRPEGMQVDIVEKDGCTTFNVKLPLESLGLGTVKDGRKFALFVARSNCNFKDGYRESSAWGAMPGNFNYSDMAYWGEGVFVEDDGSGPAVNMAPRGDLKVNYFANPVFAVDGRAWEFVGKGSTLRRETMPMSREWIVRTTGDSYHFLKGAPQRYERDTEYTLEIRARGYGGESQMNILEMYRRDEDCKMREGTHIADQVLLGEQFHTYYFPFRSTDKGTPQFMLFYKREPISDTNRGIDVASIRLFKGKVGALEIRKVARSGRKAPVEAGVPLPRNPYGKSAVQLRGLVINRHFRGRREVMEVFEGTGAEVDVLSTTAPDQDIYMTDDDADRIKKRLKGKEYDFFCVMSSVAENVGAEVSAKIIECVRDGAGLYFMYNSGHGHFAGALAEAAAKPVGPGHPIAVSYPGNIEKGLSSLDPARMLCEGRLGKGRIIQESAKRMGELKFTMRQDLYGTTDFPFSDFADPVMLKMFVYLSGKEGMSACKAVKTHWRAVDVNGMTARSGEAADESSAFAKAVESCDVSGKYAVSLKSLDADGRTVGWNARFFDVTGPRLLLKEVRTSCSGDEPAVFAVEVKGSPSGKVRWTLEDFSGRVVESGVWTGGDIEIPTGALFTNKGVVRAYLHEGDAVKAVARADIYARDRDWQRLGNDFGVGIWGQGMAVSRDTFPLVDVQLQRAGVLCQSLPVGYSGSERNLALAMSSGMAVGGGYLGNSRWFYPTQLDDTNIRSRFGPINTRKGHGQIAKNARRVAAGVAKYGPIAYTVCDEPNLSLRFTRDEPDEEPENVAEYRRRMEVKYGTLAEYNRRHRTSHATFADIVPVRIDEARRTGNFAEYVEWRNFNVDRWCEAIRTIADSGAQSDPTLRLSLFNSFGQTAVSGNDYWKLLTKAGLGFSNEYTSMVYMRRDAIYNFDEFYRSFRPDLRVWGFTGYSLNSAQIRFTPWWFAAHRYGGFTWFAVMDWDWRFIDQPTLAFTQDAADVKSALDSSRVQSGLGRLFLSYSWAPRQVALYYSHDSLLAATLLGKERLSYEIGPSGPLHDYMYSRQGLQYLVEDLLYQFDFVAPEQVKSGTLDGYRILFMPRIIALSDAEVAKLKAFSAAGGKIVADALPGDYDELGVKRSSNPFTAAEVTVTGVNFDDLSTVQRKEMLGHMRNAGVAPVLTSEGIENLYGREAVHFTDGTNSVFVVLRMPMRSTDSEEQIFMFPKKGHVYDVRTGRYLGNTNLVSAAVPHGDASAWAVLPRKVGGMKISAPEIVEAGRDLVADIALEGAVDKGVVHVEVVPPSGECRFHMKRNLDTVDGKAKLMFRMAQNDPCGEWTLRVEDALTRAVSEHRFTLKGK